MQWARNKQNTNIGFTIVELLIVVVVIAILAAITIVSYNGITRRANEAAAQSALDSAHKKISIYTVDHGDSTYPADLDSVGVTSSDSVKYKYAVNTTTNPHGYCVTATANGVSYHLGKDYTVNTGSGTATVNTSSAQNGACPGHSETGGETITNHAPNPSIEASLGAFSGPNGSVIARSTERAHTGDASVRVTLQTNVSYDNGGVMIFREDPFVSLKPNTKYVASAYVWVPAGTALMRMSVQGSGRTVDDITERLATVRGQWTRIWNTFTTLSSGVVAVYILNGEVTSPSVTTDFWADSIMITEGTTPPPYKDGNSTNWIWHGATSLSQSSGPL